MSLITEDIDIIIKSIKNGEIVAVPTDTVYGLAANAFNESAVKQLFKIKNRPMNLPLSIAVKNEKCIEKYTTDMSEMAKKMIDKYLPGPLTIILKKNKLIPDIVTANTEYVGIRIPDREEILYILNNLDFPIVLTSANIHGQKNCTTAKEIENIFGDKIKCILYSEKKGLDIPSTIVKFTENKLTIIRQGILKLK